MCNVSARLFEPKLSRKEGCDGIFEIVHETKDHVSYAGANFRIFETSFTFRRKNVMTTSHCVRAPRDFIRGICVQNEIKFSSPCISNFYRIVLTIDDITRNSQKWFPFT